MYKPASENYNPTIAPVIDDFLKEDFTSADRARNLRTRRKVGVAGLALYAMAFLPACATMNINPRPGEKSLKDNFLDVFKLEYLADDSINKGNYGEAALLLVPNCAVKLSYGTVVGVVYPIKQTVDFIGEADKYADPEERLGHQIGRRLPHMLVGAYVVNFLYNIWKHMTRKPWDFGSVVACGIGVAAATGAFDGGSVRKSQPAKSQPVSPVPAPLLPGPGAPPGGGAEEERLRETFFAHNSP